MKHLSSCIDYWLRMAVSISTWTGGQPTTLKSSSTKILVTGLMLMGLGSREKSSGTTSQEGARTSVMHASTTRSCSITGQHNTAFMVREMANGVGTRNVNTS